MTRGPPFGRNHSLTDTSKSVTRKGSDRLRMTRLLVASPMTMAALAHTNVRNGSTSASKAEKESGGGGGSRGGGSAGMIPPSFSREEGPSGPSKAQIFRPPGG